MPPDGLAAGQSGDGLVHHGLEDGGRQILLGGPFIDQGLDVRLREDAAAGGDGIEGLVALCVFVEPGGVGLDQGGHLVDEGAGAPGADAVHALFHIAALEVDDFSVFPAQLDGHVRLRGKLLQGGGHGDHFLGEGHAQAIGQGQAAGSCDHRVQRQVAQLCVSLLQKMGEGLPYVGVMALVVGKQEPVILVQNRDFDSGGADIKAQRGLARFDAVRSTVCVREFHV